MRDRVIWIFVAHLRVGEDFVEHAASARFHRLAVGIEVLEVQRVPDEVQVHDALADGRTLRVLTIVDTYTRECLAVEAASGFRGQDVARVLTRLGWERGLPRTIACDNGTEFTSRALDQWAYAQQVKLDFSRPGKPTDNAFIESFNASARRECLSQHYFIDDSTCAKCAWYQRRNPSRR